MSILKPVRLEISIHQAKYPVDRVHQVVYNMLVTNDIYNKAFDYIDPWGDTLSYI